MNELKQLQKDRNRLKRHFDRTCAYYALIAAYHLDKAVIHAKCARPTTLQEAQRISDLINFFYSKNTNPLDFMKSVDETVNESVESFQHYQNFKSKCMFPERALEGFSRWYVHAGFDSAEIKCNIGYITYIGLAIIENANGRLSDGEMNDFIKEATAKENNIFSFKEDFVKKSFVQASMKFKEINEKICLRSSQNC